MLHTGQNWVRHMDVADRTCLGEQLAELAQLVLFPREKLVDFSTCGGEQLTAQGMARIKLALDFHRKGPAFVFRSVFEQWGHQRLLLEVYT